MHLIISYDRAASHSSFAYTVNYGVVEAEEINGESELKQLYLRAVYATTKANLIERYRDYDATGDGHKSADKLELSTDDLYRDARFAIRDIIGDTHTSVELI